MKRFLSALLSLAVFCQMLFFPVSAEEISGHWAEEAIRALLAESVIGGDPDGSIRPEAEITRAEFVKTVNRVFRLTDKADENFADVREDAWYYEEFLKAKKSGYLTGDSQGNAEPERNITRAEACVILNRILAFPQTEIRLPFEDAEEIPDWAKQAVSLLKEKGLVSGYEDGTFQPSHPIRRAEAFLILWKAEMIEDAPAVPPAPTGTPAPTGAPSLVLKPGGSSSGSSGSGGGSSSAKQELAVPIPKRLSENYTYSWEPVKNASSYLVKLYFNGTVREIATAQTGAALLQDIQELVSASAEKTVTLQVCVKAVGSGRYQDSADSAKTEFTYSGQLDPPVARLSEKDYIYQWEKVKNAASYLVTLEFEEKTKDIPVSQTEAELLEEIKEMTASYMGAKATLKVSVKAVGADGYEDSEYSEPSEFVYSLYDTEHSGALGLRVVYSEEKTGREKYCAWFEGTPDQLTVRSAVGIKRYANPESPFDLSDAIQDAAGKVIEADYVITVQEKEKSDTVLADFTYAGGKGTEESPYEIANVRHFNNIHKNRNAFFVQIQDFSGGAELIPVSVQSGAPFTGSYTADTLKNVDVALSGGAFLSLFGQIQGAVIRNISVTGTIESSGPYTAGIAGLAEESEITGCENKATVTVSGSGISGGAYAGGIVGKMDSKSTLSDCSNTGSVTVQAPFAGGIAGQADGLVERCVNRGDVSNDNSALSSLPVSAAVGGIVGIQETFAGIHHCENSGKISNYYGDNLASFADKLYVVTGGIAGQAAIVNSCVNEQSAEVLVAVLSGGNPTTRNTLLLQVGGIVGYHLKGTVKECKNAGAVRSEGTANSFCGGIAGFDKGGAIALCANRGTVNSTGRGGGIAGRTMSSSVDQCYHSGAVTAASYGGGLVAHAEGGSYTNSFSAGSHTGNYNAGLIGTIAGSVTLRGCYSAPKSITALTAVIRAGSVAAKENNYFVKAAKESDAAGAATEVTAEQLSNAEAPLAGFENTEIWTFDAESGYAFPQLVNNPYGG